jgi:methylmalonyl-CoA/ethylmalonyl-CoA epimerase
MPITVTRVHQIAQRYEDLDRAIAFYRDVLALPFIAKFDPPGIAFFDLGNVRLLLEGGTTPSSLPYLEVDDIDAVARELERSGVVFEHVPHLVHRDDVGQFGPAGTEEWMAFFRDSEQNQLALIERRGPSSSV